VRIAVSGTGIGIPEEHRGRIFGVFEQVDSSTTRRFGGTGLGLAISAQLAQMMGGVLEVESVPGQGSTFHFTARFGVPGGTAERPATPDPARLEGLQVLVVDDNATNRQILVAMLSGWGIEPVAEGSASRGLAALAHACESGHPFSILLVDGHMPDMDGFGLVEAIRGDPRPSETAILMLTSAGRPEDVARCRRLGVAGYLTKPVRQSDLLDAILAVVSGRNTRPGRATTLDRTGRPSHRRLRVLLVEDNAVNRELATSLLRNVATTSRSPSMAARRWLRSIARRWRGLRCRPHDVQMPVMGGFEATQAIREKERTTGRHLPIVAMTAHAMKGDRERCLDAGMDGYVSKPIDEALLWSTLATLVPAASIAAARRPRRPAGTRARKATPGEAIAARMGGDMKLIRKVGRLFLTDYPTTLSRIRVAIRHGDAEAVRTEAHALKGSAQLAAPAAVEAAARLRRWAARGSGEGAGTLRDLRSQPGRSSARSGRWASGQIDAASGRMGDAASWSRTIVPRATCSAAC
jgi:CheY-like chemotaxis protein